MTRSQHDQRPPGAAFRHHEGMRRPHLSDVLSLPELRNPFELADRIHVQDPPTHIILKWPHGHRHGPPYDYEREDDG